VADHRRREGQDLPREAGVGEALLVAGHPGREHDLAERDARCRAGLAVELPAVLEQHVARHAGAPTSTSRNATWPPATVRWQRPRSRRPRNALLALRDWNVSGRTVHSAARSHSASDAGAPTASRGSGSENARAGAVVIAVTTVASGSTPGSTRPVTSDANAVSRPVTPFGACSNGCSFSSAACGAWSVAITSTRPERTASISASRSSSDASGG